MLDINEIKRLCGERAIRWTSHVLVRIQERGINPSDVRHCIFNGSIIEQYPSDYPHPSCLVLGTMVNGKALHVVVGVGDGFLWIITAYCPEPDKWNEDFSIRRAKQ